MKLQSLYDDYLNIKFNRNLTTVQTDSFKYVLCEDESSELFFNGYEDETFSAWISELQPRDPNYTAKPNWNPVLSKNFPQLNVYDELIFYYLLFTINATTSIIKINAYNGMNDFMKGYSFFQLSQLPSVTALNEKQQAELRDFFFFFYLYTHPVNEETLHSFSFRGQDLVHTRTGIRVGHYLSKYHDYYRDHLGNYMDQIGISSDEIDICKNLTEELLRTIEGKSKLVMPPEEGLEDLLQLINNVDLLLHKNIENKSEIFKVMAECLTIERSGPYRDHCFRMLLQNYVTYILYFNFDELNELVDYFSNTPLWCEKIINSIFTDAIFIQKIIRQNRIDITKYKNITDFFNESARNIYL
ncbi:hypothetical protein [Lysinibacillus sp. 3P01SB]|uniref:hypothetical protein n=1 Tax=Lysinibacillus sp. 3P01SB TaxID=3132284 RepID=UPI0039A5B95E